MWTASKCRRYAPPNATTLSTFWSSDVYSGQKMTSANLSAFVVGATGEVGKEVVKQLIGDDSFSKIVLIGRRKLDLPDTEANKVQQELVDFEKLQESADKFKGFDVGFCCLGTTRAQSGAQGFVRVDYDYVLETAKLAKEGECKHFHLVTSQGANPNSWLLYPKTKGQIEEAVKKLEFPRLSIYRPALLLCKREQSRPMEKLAQTLVGSLDGWGKLSIPTSAVAKAMILNSLNEKSGVEVLENGDIHKLAKSNQEK